MKNKNFQNIGTLEDELKQESNYNDLLCLSCVNRFTGADKKSNCKLLKLNKYKDTCLNYDDIANYKKDNKGNLVAKKIFL